MSPPAAGRHSSGWRTLNAAVAGVVGGVAGVVVTRALLGPGVVAVGAILGLVTMAAGIALSWWLSAPRRRQGAGRLPDGRRLRTRVHPVAWFAPVVGSAVAMLAWAGVAHSSGSGWVQAIGALLAAVLVTGLALPFFPARRASVTCTASPSDGEAAQPLTLTLVANGPLRLRPRYPVGPVARAAGSPHGPRAVEVTITPDRRGVLDRVAIELASSAPFGLLWWAREVEVVLPRPLHVAPRFGTPERLATLTLDSTGDAERRVAAGVGEPKGIRPYQPGDTRRSVHWPATAHVGTLMVREHERQTDDPVIVEVELPPDGDEAEAKVERIMATVHRELVRGEVVILVTREPDGRVTRVVRDPIDLGRRLARAVPAPAPAPDSGDAPRTAPGGWP